MRPVTSETVNALAGRGSSSNLLPGFSLFCSHCARQVRGLTVNIYRHDLKGHWWSLMMSFDISLSLHIAFKGSTGIGGIMHPSGPAAILHVLQIVVKWMICVHSQCDNLWGATAEFVLVAILSALINSGGLQITEEQEPSWRTLTFIYFVFILNNNNNNNDNGKWIVWFGHKK